MSDNVGRVTLDVTVWDESKIEALIRKIEADDRVMSVTRIDGGGQ